MDASGAWEGHLTYQKVEAGDVTVPPVSALILKDTTATPIGRNRVAEINFRLFQNYPNPFNPTTTIRYSVARQSRATQRVNLTVFNILGQRVAILIDKHQKPGDYSVTFDGSRLPSGIYFYTLQIGKLKFTKKMILMR